MEGVSRIIRHVHKSRLTSYAACGDKRNISSRLALEPAIEDMYIPTPITFEQQAFPGFSHSALCHWPLQTLANTVCRASRASENTWTPVWSERQHRVNPKARSSLAHATLDCPSPHFPRSRLGWGKILVSTQGMCFTPACNGGDGVGISI